MCGKARQEKIRKARRNALGYGNVTCGYGYWGNILGGAR